MLIIHRKKRTSCGSITGTGLQLLSTPIKKNHLTKRFIWGQISKFCISGRYIKKNIFHPILKFFFFEIVVDGFPLSPMDSEQNLTERGQNLNFLIFHLTLMHFISFFFLQNVHLNLFICQ